MVGAALVSGLLALPSAPVATAQVVDTLALRRHASVLAHDSMEGRATGSRGEHAAARTIAAELARLGLHDPTSGGAPYRQPVPLVRVRVAGAIVVEHGGRAHRFTLGDDAVFAVGGRGGLRDMAGPALFVGAPAGADPGADVAGRVLVAAGPLDAAAAPVVRAWVRGGVAGVVLLAPDAAALRAAARYHAARDLLVDATVDDPVWQPDLPVLIAGPALAAALLEGVALPPAAFTGDAMAPVPLGRVLRTEFRFGRTPVDAANVVGLLPGSDSVLRDEYVVYTAHYDHLGIGPAVDGDSIYNGFSDNAAGVAMLLGIADALRARPPARSVLFLFPTGEELGLLGSTYHAAAAPSVPLARIAGVINLDAGAPPAPPVRWRIAGDTAAAALATAAGVIAEYGWDVVRSSATPNSDHWPFLARGVPAVFLVPGDRWEGLGAAERDALRARWDRYHHPADEYAPDFPFAGLGRYADLALAIGLALADGEAGSR